MLQKIILFLFSLNIVFANSITDIKELNIYKFENAFEKKVTIPLNTKKILVSFNKKSNSFMSEYLNKQDKGFLEKNHTIYIGDIHKMPSVIVYMFARPKMKEYNFDIYLYNSDDLTSTVPTQEDKVTVIDFDDNGKVLKINFVDTPLNIF